MWRRFISRWLAALALAGIAFATPARAGDKGWGTASDVARNALVLAAIGVPLARDDEEGMWQAGGSMAAAFGTTFLLKSAIHAERPDGSGNDSFPSGHTSVSFAAAATLHNRHGWEIGLPAHIAAAFVAVARVKANRHRWYEVLAGAAIGEAAGLLVTNRLDENVQVFPWAGDGGGGVAVYARF